MKARNLFHDPNNKSSEETAIYLQNLLPTKEKSNSSSFEPANANPAVNIPSFISSRTPGSTKPPFPGVVVVVNTQCLNKPMLASRRSSYQKILALEKEGAHVVERDINLPLDLIFSAGVCLVWYETAAFGNSSRNMTDGASCIQMFMENIATNVLISLSYSFSSCIMVKILFMYLLIVNIAYIFKVGKLDPTVVLRSSQHLWGLWCFCGFTKSGQHIIFCLFLHFVQRKVLLPRLIPQGAELLLNNRITSVQYNFFCLNFSLSLLFFSKSFNLSVFFFRFLREMLTFSVS